MHGSFRSILHLHHSWGSCLLECGQMGPYSVLRYLVQTALNLWAKAKLQMIVLLSLDCHRLTSHTVVLGTLFLGTCLFIVILSFCSFFSKNDGSYSLLNQSIWCISVIGICVHIFIALLYKLINRLFVIYFTVINSGSQFLLQPPVLLLYEVAKDFLHH